MARALEAIGFFEWGASTRADAPAAAAAGA
jgi:hypothetical protein